MLRKYLWIFVLILATSVTLACRITADLPIRTIETGPTQTEEIEVLAQDAADMDVTLSFGAGELQVSPGAEDALIRGTARYNVDDLKPEIEEDGDEVRLSSGDTRFDGIPNFRNNMVNEWDLQLGESPMNLTIQAGAYQGIYELGGLSLLSLDVTDGAADVEMDFSEPNLVEMETFRYQTGASSVDLNGLANANFERMVFKSGAGDYTLNFSGELQRDATIDIESGISQVTIIVPEGVSAEVNYTGGLSNVDADPEWERSGDEYTQEGDGPKLTFNVDLGAGDLQLRTR